MSSAVVVREPEVADARAIARVHGRAWQAGYAGHIPAERLENILSRLDKRTESWHTALTESTAGLLVACLGDEAERPGELIGVCSYGEARDALSPDKFGELQMINLEPTAWGTGAADALFSLAVARLAERFDGAYLWVSSGNQRAQRFYRRHGWEPDGVTQTVEHGVAAGLDVVRYSIEFRSSP